MYDSMHLLCALAEEPQREEMRHHTSHRSIVSLTQTRILTFSPATLTRAPQGQLAPEARYEYHRLVHRRETK